MKKIIIGSLVAVTAMMFTGCSIITNKTGNMAVADMNSADKYIVGKTTLAEAQQELGETIMIFEKDNGQVKYVWTSTEGSVGIGAGAFIPFMPAEMSSDEDTNTLALTFDKHDILVKKLFKTGKYKDPDVIKMKNKIMKQYTNNLK